ncbi:cysteine synthase [Desulfohalovibrio reitneri]|uniref:cysteine synthase n=1 Tax=Desulfohalovibrio reitneri TaxID=1307759 RepID=UPI0004A7478E|nr:cysteine synthase [Desulfohalovibrio reitneri]
MIHSNILELIGHTPLVELQRLGPVGGVRLVAKLEAKSAGGSIKDRVSLAMIRAAEASGELTPDKTVIEATSGNTGIGLAMVCAVLGYRLMLLMPESASEERKRIMRAYGAELMLTPGHLSTDGAIEEAYRLAREEPDRYVLMDQFNNPASIQAHYEGTAEEIWEQTGGEVTHVVSTLGTSGTAMGLSRRLHELSGTVKVVAMEPHAGHKIQGLKNMQESYPPGIFDKSWPDRIVRVEDEEAFETARRMAREEGLFVGMSSGAAGAAAMQLARELDEAGETGLVVFICPDGGERYLSTPLFALEQREGPRVFDLASGGKTPLVRRPDGLGIFTPGPSLDVPGDLQAWRRILLAETLARRLNARGVPARCLVGLADMDDRALEASRAKGISREALAREVRKELGETAAKLGVDASLVSFAGASGESSTPVELTTTLLSRGLAYEKLRSVYFDVERDRRYGQTAHKDTSGLRLGHTVDLEAYLKQNPMDFTLLKRASLADLKQGEVLETRWGKVRPSWFVQLAAAAVDNLPGVDVFLVSESQRFPHLENFAAIFGQAARTIPQAWMIAQPVELREAGGHGEPPSVGDLLAEHDPLAVRMWLLSTSYHRPLALAPDSMSMWTRNRRKAQDLYAALAAASEGEARGAEEAAREASELRSSLESCLDDDLALHRFWPSLFSAIRAANGLLGKGGLSGAPAAELLEALREVDGVLGFIDPQAAPIPQAEWPVGAADLVRRRQEARKARDFEQADRLRDELGELGLRVEDTPGGSRLYRTST